MRGSLLKLAVPCKRSGAEPTFMPMMLATVKMMTPESADAFSSTRICTGHISSQDYILSCSQPAVIVSMLMTLMAMLVVAFGDNSDCADTQYQRR